MEASGIVGKVISRNTKVGITYSFTLDDREDERWFGTFKAKAPAEGTFVTFDYKKSGAFLNVDMDTLVVEDAPDSREQHAGMAPPKAAAAFKGASNKDANIQWQSARNAAIQLLGVAVPAGACSLGGGKAEAKLEALTIQLNALTLEFFDQSMEVSATGDAPADFRS